MTFIFKARSRKIGHTKSGKAVYHGAHRHKHPSYKNFSSEDHKDAAKIHHEHAMHYADAMIHALEGGDHKKFKQVQKHFRSHHKTAHKHALKKSLFTY